MKVTGAETTYSALLGFAVKEEREQAQKSQKEVASALGIGQSSWAKIENGHVPINANQLGLVSEVLSTTPAKIVERADFNADSWKAAGNTVRYSRASEGVNIKTFLTGAALGVILAAVVHSATKEEEPQEAN